MRRAAVVGAVLVALLAVAFPGQAASTDGEEKWALVIGIDRFKGRTRPNVGGVGDANAVRRLLLRHGWRDDHIRVLTDADATAAAIRSGLQWLVDRSGPTSMSVFHYSGHVKQIGGDRDRDGEALDEYLWPHDNVFISDGELAGFLRRLEGDAWIDVSGCEAAGFDDGVSGPRRLFTASSLEPEKSYEVPAWRMSMWTGLLVEAGMLRGEADADGDGWVTLAEAFDFAARRATAMTGDQRYGPQHPFRTGGDIGRWFAPPPPAGSSPAAPAAQAGRICLFGLCFL